MVSHLSNLYCECSNCTWKLLGDCTLTITASHIVPTAGMLEAGISVAMGTAFFILTTNKTTTIKY